MNTTLPVYWGNSTWILTQQNTIEQGVPLSPNSPHWIDYNNVLGDTVELLKETHSYVKYRKLLHDQIINRMFVDSDRFKPKSTPACILTHGGIASGKTSSIMLLKDTRKDQEYLHIDFDVVKRHLPEFNFMHKNGIKEAASFTQSESAKIAGKAFSKAIKKKLNIIYEGSLSNLEVIQQKIREMRRNKYEISCISTHVTLETGLQRAVSRFEQGGRYVPDETIRETYLKCPGSLVALKGLVDILYLVDNQNDRGGRLILFFEKNKFKIKDKSLYSKYLSDVGHEHAL